jgi:hypothetical protein
MLLGEVQPCERAERMLLGEVQPKASRADTEKLGEVAESAEGSRLLSGYRGKTSVPGSNPGLSATRP